MHVLACDQVATPTHLRPFSEIVRGLCSTHHMLIVALVVFTVLLVWGAAATGAALLAGGIIHERDRRDVPYGRTTADALR